MYILGINYNTNYFSHDASAALLYNNKILGHYEEERFTRIKHSREFPINSIKKLLKTNNLFINDIDFFSISYCTDIDNSISVYKNILDKEFNINIDKSKFICCDHHISHILNSYIYSNFNECTGIVIDGEGNNGDSISIAKVSSNNIKILKKYKNNISLGYFYECASLYTGFDLFGCGKLMGLASYGNIIYNDFYRIENNKIEIIKQYQILFNLILKKLEYDNHYYDSYLFKYIKNINEINNHDIYEKAIIVNLFKFFETFYPYKQNNNKECFIYYKDFAASIQNIYSSVVLAIVRQAKLLNNSNNLILSGGCIQNCSTNNLIVESKLFNNIYSSPSPHDSGIAIGNAFFAAIQNNINIKNLNIKTSYFGESYNISDISSKYLNKIKILKITNNDIINDLLNNKIIGWFSGKSEIGPRALCHRSIIANPSIRENLIIINKYIKNREIFRPLAPVIIDKLYTMVFESEKYDLTEFMLRNIKIKKQYRKKLIAICHIDNTSRPQVLLESTNTEMYKLLLDFYNKTKIPALINTSFNRNNEPIIESIDNAIDMMLNIKELDYIVLNSNIKIERI